ncbi:MAG: glutathione S-transferase family protein [Pseudohaliea sp.]
MQVFERTDCPFCWKVRLAAAELGVALDLVASRPGEPHPEVSRLSPTATVPVLRDGTVGIWESAVICGYLDERASGGLYGRSPAARAAVRLFEAYSDRLAADGLRDAVFELRSKAPGERDDGRVEQGLALWRERLVDLAARLGDRPWFAGDFSLADCALGPRFGVAEAYGIHVFRDHDNLAAWFERLKARPAWQQAYPARFIGLERG